MLPFCFQLTGENIVNFITTNIDYLLIGKLLNATSLGYYTMAYRMVTLPHTRISPIINRVTFPLFCALQDKDKSLRKGYLLTLRLLSMLSFPLIIGLIILAPEVIELLYGETWLPVVAPLRFLVMVGLLKAVGSAAGSVILSKGRPDIGLKINLSVLLCLGIGLAWSARWEVNGIAIAYSIIFIFAFPFVQKTIGGLISLGLRSILRALLPAGLGSVVMGSGIVAIRWVHTHRTLFRNDLTYLLVAILTGTVLYIGFIRIVYPEHFFRIKNLIRTMFTQVTS
jgi:PST family polysaccharide transporter